MLFDFFEFLSSFSCRNMSLVYLSIWKVGTIEYPPDPTIGNSSQYFVDSVPWLDFFFQKTSNYSLYFFFGYQTIQTFRLNFKSKK